MEEALTRGLTDFKISLSTFILQGIYSLQPVQREVTLSGSLLQTGRGSSMGRDSQFQDTSTWRGYSVRGRPRVICEH